MKIELKPCPFCGAECDETGWLDGNGNRGPECSDCGATAMSKENWNRRALPEIELPEYADAEDKAEMLEMCRQSVHYAGLKVKGES